MAEHRISVVQDCLQHSRQDHRIANQRKHLIEARKEYIEVVNMKKVRMRVRGLCVGGEGVVC